LLYEFLPFLPKIAVLNADEVVAVYDDSGNGSPPEKIWCYYSIAAAEEAGEGPDGQYQIATMKLFDGIMQQHFHGGKR
jgi:hypothetical protein